MDFKTMPFPHQRECWELIKDQPYYGLFCQPGLGKTKIALDTITYRLIKDPNYKTLVVCPNTVVENWLQEVSIHSDMKAVALIGSKKKRIQLLDIAKLSANNYLIPQIFVINYEALRIITEELKHFGFDFLVADESTEVKNPKSLQSKACFAIAGHIPHKLIMTGTPILNNPLDIFAQYRILNQNIFGTNFYRFRSRYAVLGGYMNYQVVKWINMNDLKKKVFSCAIRKTKEQCLDLPEKLYQVVRLEMTEEQSKIYKALKDDFYAEMESNVITAPVMLTRLLRFAQITSGFTKDIGGIEHDFPKNPKVEWVVDFIRNLDADRKVVVFCRFIREVVNLEKALRVSGISYVTVRGGTDDRLKQINDFNNDPSVRVFIGSLQAAGIGINLTAGTYAIFLSNTFSYGERVQAEDRTHRIGQTKNVTIIDLVMRGTVDEHIVKALKQKKSLSDFVVDDMKGMV